MNEAASRLGMTSAMRWKAKVAIAATVVLGAAQISPAAAQSLPPRIILGAGAAGTLQNSIATAIAKLVSETAKTTVVVQPYSGTTAFMPLLKSGELDLALAPSVDFAMAYLGPNRIKIDGQNPYQPSENLRLVMGGIPLIASLVVRKDSDIHAAGQLKGKTIAGSFPAQLGARWNMFAQLAGAGLTWKDVKVVPFTTINGGLDALVQKQIDATVYGVGAPKIREADATVGVRYASSDCSPAGKKRMTDLIPGYYTINLKPGSFAAVVENTCTTAYDLYIAARKDTPDAIVTAFIEAAWDHPAKLAAMHRLLKRWTHAAMVNDRATIPFHPAAIKFYKSKGAWNAKMDALQARLLAKAK